VLKVIMRVAILSSLEGIEPVASNVDVQLGGFLADDSVPPLGETARSSTIRSQ
jgi:hypothetical protein